jgi:hypothetical protein
MMSVKEYLAKAAEFEALASGSDDPPMIKKRLADLADAYRHLAKERQRLIEEGVIASDAPPP